MHVPKEAKEIFLGVGIELERSFGGVTLWNSDNPNLEAEFYPGREWAKSGRSSIP